VAALVVLLILSFLAFWVTRVLVRDQESRLLTERAREVQLVFNTAISDLPTTLGALGDTVKTTKGSITAFDNMAKSELATSTSPLTYAWLAPAGGGFRVKAEVGGGLTVGQTVGGPRALVLAEALGTAKLAPTSVIGSGSKRLLGFALGPPSAPAGTVLYRQSNLGPVAAPRQASTAAFSELKVVLYASPKVDPAQVLVTTTRDLPLHGSARYEALAVGGTNWTLGVAAIRPLVGSVAANAPWVVLGGAAIGAVLIAAVIEVAARRRDEALRLYASEHQLAETLQRSLLPELPALPGLELAARYLAGEQGQEVGGDWFDAFAIPGDRVGVVIGDVIGHDIRAAAAMSQIRATLRAFAWQGDRPAQVLDQLDRLVNTLGLTPLVTVFYGILEAPASDGGRLFRYANAGHLPPLVKDPQGRVQFLTDGASVVIGAPAVGVRGQAEQLLPAGATLLLYTDGLVEVPGGSLQDALVRLANTVAEDVSGLNADALCEHLLASAPVGGLRRDDVALLAVHLPAPRRNTGITWRPRRPVVESTPGGGD